MICQRSGYCCIHMMVMIVDDPDLGPTEGNIIHKPTGEKCKHLQGDIAGKYSCAIHDKDWFVDSPCGQFTQVETHNTLCRLGVAYLEMMKGKSRDSDAS